MSISFGADATSANFNAAFMSRTSNTDTAGQVDLNNAAGVSGAAVANIQRLFNHLQDTVGVSANISDDANAKVYATNNVISDGQSRKEALEAIDANEGAKNLFYSVTRTKNILSAIGTTQDVTVDFAGQTPGADASTKGVVTDPPYNRISLVDQTTGAEIVDGSGRRVFARLTYSAPNWTLSFFVNIAGVETAHNLTPATDLTIAYAQVYDDKDRPTFADQFAQLDGIQAIAEIPDASASQRGVVSTDAQTFSGVKEFQSRPTTGGADIVDVSASQVITNKDIDGGTASNTNRLTLSKGATAALTALTRKQGNIFYDTDLDNIVFDDGVALNAVGTGSGGGGETSSEIWHQETWEVNDVASVVGGNGATPFQGGAIVGTLANEGASPLSGLRSISFTQAIGSLNDHFYSGAIAVPEKARGKDSTVIVNAKYSNTNNEVQCVIYDQTNSTTLDSFFINQTTSQRYTSVVSIPSTCTEIRIGFQVTVENAGAVLIYDDEQVTQFVDQAGGGGSLESATFTYEFGNGGAAGSSIGGAWTAYPINTADPGNNLTGVSLSASQITGHSAGKYEVDYRLQLAQANRMNARLRDVSGGGATLSKGVQASAPSSVTNLSLYCGRKTTIDLTGSETLELQYWAQTGQATFGLGIENISDGEDDVTAFITLTKIG